MLIVDAHLDVAWNALYNARDLTLEVDDIRAGEPADHPAVAMTSLAGFSRAGVALVFATLYATPGSTWANSFSDYPTARPPRPYATPSEAEETALEMLALYERWERDGLVRIVADAKSLDDHLDRFTRDGIPGLLLAIEGADPIVSPDDLPRWFARRVRMIGLAWGTTRYAGGTGSSAGLTAAGRELLAGMAELGIVHDAAHLSEEAFWEAAGLEQNGLCVTHASARALMARPGAVSGLPLNRFLSDEQIAEVARSRRASTGGVVGVGLLNCFLEPCGLEVTVAAQVTDHLRHVASIAGWRSVGIGSDVDAAYGRDDTPQGLDSIADWPLVAEGVPEDARLGVLGENWLRFLRETLPAGGSGG